MTTISILLRYFYVYNLVLSSSVIEVASGDYGDVNQVLSDAAQAALPPEENEKNPRDETTSTRVSDQSGPHL